MSYDGKQLKAATVTKDKLALVDPTANLDPATKQWTLQMLDSYKYNQNWKDPVRAASTANVNTSSPGAAIDGVSLVAGDRVLLKDQSTASQNGIWVWNGAAVAMTRAVDADGNSEMTANVVVAVSEGTANADTAWKLTTNNPIVVGTTALTFSNFVPSTTAPTPTRSNKYMTAAVTTADGDVACNTALASAPANTGFIEVLINSDFPELGDGVKTKDCYFSGDSGVTARAWTAITNGDKLYWNGSIAGYQLAATDKVSFLYNV